MRISLLFFLVVLCVQLPALAIEVAGEKLSAGVEQRFRGTVAKVREVLPDGLKKYDGLRAYYSPQGSNLYATSYHLTQQDISHNLERINKYREFKLHWSQLQTFVEKVVNFNEEMGTMAIAHEFGHYLLDEYLREHSPAHLYWTVWHRHLDQPRMALEDPETEKAKYDGRIKDLQEQAVERLVFHTSQLDRFTSIRQKGYQTDVTGKYKTPLSAEELQQLDQTIATFEAEVAQLEEQATLLYRTGPAVQRRYGNVTLTHLFNSNNLKPYHELFADTIAVLAFGDWEAVHESLKVDFAREVAAGQFDFDKLAEHILLPSVSPQEDAYLTYLRARVFPQQYVSAEAYQFAAWEAADPYTQFTPTRSYIRHLKEVEGRSPEQIINALAQAILTIHETILVPNVGLYEIDLVEKNRQLVNAIEAHLL